MEYLPNFWVLLITKKKCKPNRGEADGPSPSESCKDHTPSNRMPQGEAPLLTPEVCPEETPGKAKLRNSLQNNCLQSSQKSRNPREHSRLQETMGPNNQTPVGPGWMLLLERKLLRQLVTVKWGLWMGWQWWIRAHFLIQVVMLWGVREHPL